jgi:hypothetical protein
MPDSGVVPEDDARIDSSYVGRRLLPLAIGMRLFQANFAGFA